MAGFEHIVEAPDSLPKETSLGRVCLVTADLNRQLEFYTKVIGLELLSKDARGASLGTGGGELLHLDYQAGKRHYDGGTGLYHFCLAVPQREEFARLLKRVLDSGRPLQGLVDHHVAEAIYLPDAEGNGVELNWDRPREAWPESMTVMMRRGNGPLDTEGLLDLAEKAGPGEGRLPSDAWVGHIHLHVRDLNESRAFYHDALGMDITGEFARQAVFTSAGGYHHHIAFNVWNGRGADGPPSDATGLAWFEVKVPAGELNSRGESMKLAGLDGRQVENGLEFLDPSGIHLRLVSIEKDK